MSPTQRRQALRFDETVWREAVRGFSRRPLEIVTSARRDAERLGVALPEVLPCEAHGPDGTALAGCAKLYLPVGEAPPSERPFARAQRLRASASPAAWPVPRAWLNVTARAGLNWGSI